MAGETPSMRKRLAWLALLPGLLLLLLLALWLARKPIAAHFVDRALADRGVAARYRITGVGPFVQRIENLSLGDAAAPDLVADWAEIRIGWGGDGPYLAGVTASGVRLRGRIVDGALRLGAVDKLLPPPSGKPFALPDMDADLRDARMALETPAGRVGLVLDGKGRLNRDFRGRLMVHVPRFAAGGCQGAGLLAPVDIVTGEADIRLRGPVDLGGLRCGEAVRLDQLSGRADLVLGTALDSLRGPVSLLAEKGELAGLAAKQWRFAGRMEADIGAASGRISGDIGFVEAAAPAGWRDALATAPTGLDGSPVGPLAPPLAEALARAAGNFGGKGRVAVRYGKAIDLNIADIAIASASGARLALADGKGFGWSSDKGVFLDGALQLAGGGLPAVAGRMTLAGDAGQGRFTVAPYAARDARLALAPVLIAAGPNGYRLRTAATLDGPLGDGRVRGLSLPLDIRLAINGAWSVNPACAPLAFESLAVAGLALAPASLPLCPRGDALVASTRNGVAGGGAIRGLRLSGRMSGSPLTMASRSFGFDIGTPGFTADAVAVRLGQGDAVSRLDIACLAGRTDPGGLGGTFTGAAGKIAAVPLLLSEGAGRWRLANADLAIDGAIAVADEAAEPRFNPLRSDDVRLTLIDGKVRATGQLREPATNVAVASVAIDHDLGRSSGEAVLDVAGITFGPALQPEQLTRLTLGVVANVAGSVSGRGHIGWTEAGVASTGTFRTDSLDLAAAFGPVKGLSGEIHFSDLLGLETPPGQEVRLAEVNPGVAVEAGVVRYRLLAGQQVQIEGGRWPFSGGELFLEPTTLDFARPVERRMTFRVEGLDAAQFIQRFDFDNIAGTGIFDGTLPMVFDDAGGRIENGRLLVRRGGGTLAYVGELSNEDLGTYGKMAFDALKSIRYDNLAIALNGNLDGEIVSEILFTGINEQPLGGERLEGMAKELTGLPFKFNITVRAPFRGLVSTASNFVDPTGLIRNQGKGDSNPPVQAQESEDKR